MLKVNKEDVITLGARIDTIRSTIIQQLDTIFDYVADAKDFTDRLLHTQHAYLTAEVLDNLAALAMWTDWRRIVTEVLGTQESAPLSEVADVLQLKLMSRIRNVGATYASGPFGSAYAMALSSHYAETVQLLVTMIRGDELVEELMPTLTKNLGLTAEQIRNGIAAHDPTIQKAVMLHVGQHAVERARLRGRELPQETIDAILDTSLVATAPDDGPSIEEVAKMLGINPTNLQQSAPGVFTLDTPLEDTDPRVPRFPPNFGSHKAPEDTIKVG
jgi:hypothetical protein